LTRSRNHEAPHYTISCHLLLPRTPTHLPKHPALHPPHLMLFPPAVTDTSSQSHQTQAKSVCCLSEYFVISNSAVKHNLKYSSQCLSLLNTRESRDIILSTATCTPVYWYRRFATTCSCHLQSRIPVSFPALPVPSYRHTNRRHRSTRRFS